MWWKLRGDALGSAVATIDRRSKAVIGPGDVILSIPDSQLVIEAMPRPAHQSGAGDVYSLVVRDIRGSQSRC